MAQSPRRRSQAIRAFVEFFAGPFQDGVEASGGAA
jgi:hypothetical protein